MKLHELIIEDLPCINEVLTAKFDKIVWDQQGKSFTAKCLFGEEEINLTLDVQSFKTSERSYIVAMLNFDRLVNGKTTTLTVDLNRNTFNLLGAVANAFKEKIKNIEPAFSIKDSKGFDAVVGMVDLGQEKKADLYKRIMQKIGSHGVIQTNTENGVATISLLKQFNNEDAEAFSDAIKKLGKAVR